MLRLLRPRPDERCGRGVRATGGLDGIYLLSTNQPGTVGDGVAMACRVGARVIDLESVQFHPTVFFPRPVSKGCHFVTADE